jgi:hypothetical protein
MRHATNPDDGLKNALAKAVSSLFGFAPGGVYLAIFIAENAVRSYRTLSPLLGRLFAGSKEKSALSSRNFAQKSPSGILSVALSLGSPPAAVSRHRFFMEPGLSSNLI